MKALDFFFAARPMLHLPVWSIYLVALKYRSGEAGKTFTSDHFLILVLFSLLAGGAYYLNQVYDIDSDRLNKKLGFLQENVLTPRELRVGFWLLSLSAIGGGVLVSFIVGAVCVQMFVLGYLYSAPPWRLKDRPLAGLFANAYPFGFLIPLAASPRLQFAELGESDWLLSLYFFLAVAAIYLMTTIPDRAGDKAVGKRTLSVIWHPRAVKLAAFFSTSGSFFLALKGNYPALMGLSLVAAIVIVVTIFSSSVKVELLAAKLPILLLTLLAGYFYPGYLLFIVVLLVASRVYYKKRWSVTYPKLT